MSLTGSAAQQSGTGQQIRPQPFPWLFPQALGAGIPEQLSFPRRARSPGKRLLFGPKDVPEPPRAALHLIQRILCLIGRVTVEMPVSLLCCFVHRC